MFSLQKGIYCLHGIVVIVSAPGVGNRGLSLAKDFKISSDEFPTWRSELWEMTLKIMYLFQDK